MNCVEVFAIIHVCLCGFFFNFPKVEISLGKQPNIPVALVWGKNNPHSGLNEDAELPGTLCARASSA